MSHARPDDDLQPSIDGTAEATGSDMYRRMPLGDSLGGTPSEHVAETLTPDDGPADWGVDGGDAD